MRHLFKPKKVIKIFNKINFLTCTIRILTQFNSFAILFLLLLIETNFFHISGITQNKIFNNNSFRVNMYICFLYNHDNAHKQPLDKKRPVKQNKIF